MYSIVLTNGKIINVDAPGTEWNESTRMIKLLKNGRQVARINMDNVACWISTKYKVESEVKANGNEK